MQGVTPGPIAVVESSPPPDTEPAEPARQEVEIVAGEEAEVIFRHGPSAQEQEQETEGTVEVRVTDAAGQPVAACIELFGGEPEAIVVCDDDEDDTDDRPGQVRIEQVPAGPYSVALSELPEGLPDPGTQDIDVEAGEIGTVDFTVASGPGTLVIFVENEDGERIGGACFTLEGETEAETLTDVCDQGDDGRLNFPDLPSGDYTIIQTRAGENRQLAPEQSVTVEPGQTVEVTLLNPREPASRDADAARTGGDRQRPLRNRRQRRRRNRLPSQWRPPSSQSKPGCSPSPTWDRTVARSATAASCSPMPPMSRLPRCATTTPAISTARRESSPSAVSPLASTR